MRVEELLDRAMAASQGGRREEARDLLLDVLAQDPVYLEAWLRLAELAASPERAVLYYQRAAAIDPRSLRVQKGLAEAQGKLLPAAEREGPVPEPAQSRETRTALPKLGQIGRAVLPPDAPIFVDRDLPPLTLELTVAPSPGKTRPTVGRGGQVVTHEEAGPGGALSKEAG